MPRRPSKKEYAENPVRDLEEDIFNEAFQGRGGGTWAGTAFGLFYGSAAGAAIGLIPSIAGFGAFTWTGLGGSAALCGALGALSGRVAGADNGSAAGAAVGGTKVVLSEVRSQMKGLKQELQDMRADLAVRDGVLTPEQAGQLRQLPAGSFAEGEPAEKTATGNHSGYIKWKTMLLSVGLGAVVGAVVWAASYLLADGAAAEALKENQIGKYVLEKIGFGGSAGAQLLGSSLIGGAIGGGFGFNIPLITAKLHMVARQCINGRIFEKAEEPEQAREIQHTGSRFEQISLEESPACSRYQDLIAVQRGQGMPLLQRV